MSHISTVRYLVGVGLVLLITGSTTVIGTDNHQQEHQTVQKSAAFDKPKPIDPTELHGEIPNSDPIKRSTSLAKGDLLGDNIGQVVAELEPTLGVKQVNQVVSKLLDDIRLDTGVTDLVNLHPGVEVTVFRRFNDRGERIWTVYAGKYSGIGQNAK